MAFSSTGSGLLSSGIGSVSVDAVQLTPVLQPVPLLDILSGQVSGVDRNSPSDQARAMKAHEKELTALVGKVDVSEKPAEKGPVISDQTARAHGSDKQERIEGEQGQLAADVKVITDKIAALQEGPVSKRPDGGGSPLRSGIGQLISTGLTAAVAAAIPPVGAALVASDALAAASFAGKGTEVTFSQTASELGRPLSSSSKKGGYARSESASSSTTLTASAAPAPVLSPVGVTNGPGFGPKPPTMAELARTDETLNDTYLKGIDLRLENTVRGKSLAASLENSARVQETVAKIRDRGLEDPDHVKIALDRGMIRDQQLGQSAPRPMMG